MMVSGCDLPVMELERSWGLESRDFFRTRAQLPLSENFLMVGARCRLSTNSEAILKCARKLLASLPAHGGNTELDFRFWVDPTATAASQPWPKPYFRGWGQFIFAGFDGFNSFLVDLNTRQVIGRFTRAFAEDEAVWKKIVFPVLPAMLGQSIPVSILHGACVEHNGRGLLLVGPSGAGKSTLALALGREGLGFLSDDRTYLSLRNGRLFAWSSGGFLKLRCDDSSEIPGAEGRAPSLGPRGDSILELDPEMDLGFKRVKCCEPGTLVFIGRGSGATPEIRPAESAEVAAHLERDLKCDANDARFKAEVARELAQLPCYTLLNQGLPNAVSKALLDILAAPPHGAQLQKFSYSGPVAPTAPPAGDPLRQSTRLALTLPISVMGKVGSLATNSTTILETARKLFPQQPGQDPAKFTWRIVSEMGDKGSPPWPSSSAFSSGPLRYVNIGQRGFAAINLNSAEVSGFIPENLARDEAGFASIFLATLFYLTAPILGLTPLKAACVAKDGRGLLLLGPARSGKTTCAYASSKLGLEFHADMASFLELHDEGLHSWGEFWPALFREETTRVYPELKFLGRRLEHATESFIALDKNLLSPQPARPVKLALAVVLERGAHESPRMTRLSSREYRQALQASPPHDEDGPFKLQQEKLLAKLAGIPAYKLTYGNDAAEAAMFCRSLLTAQDILKAVP